MRPAPRVTVDFGDGRRLERTLTGNSVHYVLSPDGRPIDALPGLYAPRAFLAGLAEAEAAAARLRPRACRRRSARGRSERLPPCAGEALRPSWPAELGALGVRAPLPRTSRPAPPVHGWLGRTAWPSRSPPWNARSSSAWSGGTAARPWTTGRWRALGLRRLQSSRLSDIRPPTRGPRGPGRHRGRAPARGADRRGHRAQRAGPPRAASRLVRRGLGSGRPRGPRTPRVPRAVPARTGRSLGRPRPRRPVRRPPGRRARPSAR